MSVASDLWNWMNETPDEKRIRKMRETRAKLTGKTTSSKSRNGIEPEHFEVTLNDGRVIRW